jgi:hypothetical protein
MLLPVIAVGFVIWGLRRRGQHGGPEDVQEQPAEATRDGFD